MTEPGTPTKAASPVSSRSGAADRWAGLDRVGRSVVGGGAAVAVVALIGVVLGTWRLDGVGLALLLAGLLTALVAWAAASGVGSSPVAPAWLEVAGGLVAFDVALLNAIELLFDLDQLEEWGGPIGVVVSLAALVAAGVLLMAAVRRADVSRPAGWLGPQSVRLATIGASLAVIGAALHVSIGVLVFHPTLVYGLVAALLALVVVRAAHDPGAFRLPFPAAWLAVVLAALSAVFLLDIVGTFFDRSNLLDPADWLYLAIQVAGVAILILGSLVAAGFRLPSGGAPPAAG